jgi:hypothetical protein
MPKEKGKVQPPDGSVKSDKEKGELTRDISVNLGPESNKIWSAVFFFSPLCLRQHMRHWPFSDICDRLP